MHIIKDKDLPFTYLISFTLWGLILSIIGWEYFTYSLVIIGISFTLGFLAYRYLTNGWASCTSFVLILLTMGGYEAISEAWAKAFPVFLAGFLPGARIGFYSQKKSKNKKIGINIKPKKSMNQSMAKIEKFKFIDSQGKELHLDSRQETTKGFFGRIKTKNYLKMSIDDVWAEFDADDFHTVDLDAGEIIESTASIDGPVFITNVDFAQEGSLFWEHVQAIPAHRWVICFANLDERPIRAIFTNEHFTEFLEMLDPNSS
ncbi:hypothetical protein [Rothia nasisuis]|uniref:hypothetical protein n=2 Tax=Rothia nasisuis TaxID=2109647 RepID=UPI001F2FAD4A|nr:hypothetical protein [Rothia nasisuis]